MDSELLYLISRTTKYSKEVYALNESIAVRRKQLQMKLSTQSASKTDYYRKEIDRDRNAKETKEQNLKEELEVKLERLKREYDANVKDITEKLEKKASKIREDSETYQRYCNTNMNQELNEDSDLVLVKLKEQHAIAKEHLNKCQAMEDAQTVKVARWKKEEAMAQLKLEEEKTARREAELLNTQRLAAIAREDSIRKEVARCKAEKEKDREEKEESLKVVQPEKDKRIHDRDDLRRVQDYSKAIYNDDLPVFNLLTTKEKIRLVKGQNLDKQVKEYQDELKGKELTSFLDDTERNRYRTALGEGVLQEQRSLIEEFAKNNLILKEYLENETAKK